jgi:RES domain-containing protein
VIYAAGSYAGALLEILVHARRVALHEPYHALPIQIPRDVAVTTVTADDIPGWDAADYVAARTIGDTWLAQGKTAVLRVPAVTGRPHETHVLINPRHAAVGTLRFEAAHPVVWDGRLVASSG